MIRNEDTLQIVQQKLLNVYQVLFSATMAAKSGAYQ